MLHFDLIFITEISEVNNKTLHQTFSPIPEVNNFVEGKGFVKFLYYTYYLLFLPQFTCGVNILEEIKIYLAFMFSLARLTIE